MRKHMTKLLHSTKTSFVFVNTMTETATAAVCPSQIQALPRAALHSQVLRWLISIGSWELAKTILHACLQWHF